MIIVKKVKLFTFKPFLKNLCKKVTEKKVSEKNLEIKSQEIRSQDLKKWRKYIQREKVLSLGEMTSNLRCFYKKKELFLYAHAE